MTFSASVKAELCAVTDESRCCLKAELYGMLLFARAFSLGEISLQTENEMVAKRYYNLLKKVCGVTAVMHYPRVKGGMITATVQKKGERERVLSFFSHTGQELVLRVNRANLEEECCPAAFLRGAFLVCGTMTDPQKDYHLEFLLSHRKLSLDLTHILTQANLEAKTTERRGAVVVYFKESENIEDLLTLMKATNSSLLLMNVKIYKDLRNRVNRVTNCETANLSKTVEAVRRQLWAIDLIDQVEGLDSLPPALREIAEQRRAHEEMSLSELGEVLNPPLTRSGVNHRLQKLILRAQELERQKG